MYVKDQELHLYSVTLQKKSNYIASCTGHFIDLIEKNGVVEKKTEKPDSLQVVLATQSHLELYDVSESRFDLLCEVPLFARVTTIESISTKTSTVTDEKTVQETYNNDHLVLLCDSGYISINKFYHRLDNHCIALENVLLQPLYRNGLRRFSPIYRASLDTQSQCIVLDSQDSKRTCFLINAENTLEQQAKVAGINDMQTITLGSPIEQNNKNRCIITSCVLENLKENNPVVASIEYDYDTNTLLLQYSMLDLNMRYMVSLQSKLAELKCNEHFILALPILNQYGASSAFFDEKNPCFLVNGDDGYIRVLDLQNRLGYEDCKIKIPTCEAGEETHHPKIVSGHIQKLKQSFFVLLQAASGDCFKFLMSFEKNNSNTSNRPKYQANRDYVPSLHILYFESLPKASTFHIFKNGLLLTVPEYTPPTLYQFESLAGSDSEETYVKSQELTNLSERQTLYGKLTHPVLRSSLVTNNCPLTVNLSTGKTISLGSQFTQLIATDLKSSTGSPPEQIWTTDQNRMLVLSFQNNTTTFLSIRGDSIDELQKPANEQDNFFVTKKDKTIYFCQLYNSNSIQVTNNYFLHFRHNIDFSNVKRVLKWLPPAGVKITLATHSKSQLCIVLSNNEIIYFELSEDNTSLNEFQDHIDDFQDEHNNEISAIALSSDEMKSNFLLIASRTDHLLKLYSLKKNDTFMENLAMQVLTDTAVSLIYVEALNECYIGLSNGIYTISKVNPVESIFYDIRSKYLGTKPVKLNDLKFMDTGHIHEAEEEEEKEEEEEEEEEEDVVTPESKINGQESNALTESTDKKITVEKSLHSRRIICAHSNKSWISYTDRYNKLHIRPVQLSGGNHNFSNMLPFKTADVAQNGVCSITNKGLMVIGKLGNFDENTLGVLNSVADDKTESTSAPNIQTVYLQETDRVHHKILHTESKFKILSNDFETHWFDHHMITAHFLKIANLKYFFVSTHDCKILTFQLFSTKEGNSCKLLHETFVGVKVYCMESFREKLLLPVNNVIVLYTVGKSQILKKSFTFLPSSITKVVSLDVFQDSQLAVADVRESVTVCVFHEPVNQFLLLADDIIKKFCVSVKFLDHKTVLVSDKFGGVSTLRVPEDADDLEVFIIKNYPNIATNTNDPGQIKFETNNDSLVNIMDCPLKLTLQNHIFYDDIIMHWHVIDMCNMSDRSVIIGLGLQGSLLAMIPLLTKKEVQVLKNLSDTLRLYDLKKCDLKLNHSGRDHLLYTSITGPSRNIIDGDYCETFYLLSSNQQTELLEMLNEANETAPTQESILRKLDVFRALNNVRISCV